MRNELKRLGIQLVDTLFSVDDEFVKLRLSGDLTEEILIDWSTLISGGPDVDYYGEMMRSRKEIDPGNPLLSCLAGIRAYLAWAAAVTNGIVRHPAMDGTWQTVVVPLLRNLTRAGAFWAPQEFALGAVDYLRSTSEYLRQDEVTLHLADEVAWELGVVRRRLADRMGDIAYELHERLTSVNVNTGLNERILENETRAAVGALFWTMGDVTRAEALRHRTYQPSLRRLKRLVADSLRRVSVDLLVQSVWLCLDHLLGEIAGLSCRIRSVHDDASDFFEHIFRGYASAVMERHLNPTATKNLDSLTSAMIMSGGHLGDRHPDLWMRIVAFIKSEYSQADGLPSWPELARKASTIVQRDSGMAIDIDEYDVSSGIPLHYLTDEPLCVLEELESYRSSGLWYWRHLHPDGKNDAAHNILRNRISGVRYTQSVLSGPRRRIQIDGTDWQRVNGDTSQLVASAAVAENLVQIGSELAALAAARPALPSPSHPASIADFAAVLHAP
jgi:hypothetical protein